MKPHDLTTALIGIVIEECKCKDFWLQHPGPVTVEEMSRISARIEALLERVGNDTVPA
jgi:hypothetical protein